MDYNVRKDVPNEYKWNLKTRYVSDDAWENDYENIKNEMKGIIEHKNKVGKSANSLFQTLEDYFLYESRLSRLYVYASLKKDEDVGIDKYNLMVNKAYKIYSEFLSFASFIEPEVLAIPDDKIETMLKNKKLVKYIFYLNNILRYKKHMLSAKEESLMAKLTSNDNVFKNVNMMMLNSTINYGTLEVDGKETVITNSNYRTIMQSKNRETRKKCYDLMINKMKEYTNLFGQNLSANMSKTSDIAEIRNFKSTMEMELFSSNIPKKVVDNLYEVVEEKLPIFQKYLNFIKKNLGLNELEYYDLNAFNMTEEISFSIEDTQMLIDESTKIYGKEYHDVILKAFKEQWIDYSSYKGKASGAYCTSNYGNNPVILTNFHGKFGDVSAIAHELGHAVNFYLSAKNNDKHNCENDIFVAEVASLTNEIILSNYVITNSRSKNLKLTAIYNLIDIIQNNLFDACLEGQLENEIYQRIDNKETINSEILSDTILNIRKKYYGNEVKIDDNIKYLWARREHYFYPFYLYKYATGVAMAIYIANKIINGEDNMKEKYLQFLSAGTNTYPIDLLKNIGVDITKKDVAINAIDFFDKLIDKYNEESEK